jgi:hypothetical protein
MKEKIDSVDKKVDLLNTKFDLIIEKMEKKFAAKRTEWVVKGFVGLILLSVC